MNYTKTTFKNGLRVLTVPMKGVQTATVMVMVGVGTRYEKKEEAGLSHFIEHMLFKGTEKRSNALEISSELDGLGGEFNAFTSKDTTGYWVKVDAKRVGKAMDVLSDMFLNSKFEENEIRKEEGTVLQEISMYEDMLMRSVTEIFENLLYSGNGLGEDILGKAKTVKSFKQKDFLAYVRKHYVASETVVCVAGKIKEKEIIEKIEKYFFKMKKGTRNKFQKFLEKQKKPQIRIKNKKTDQTQLCLGVKTFDQDHEDRFILSVLSVILGGNMSSRIFFEVREKRGLAYHVRTFLESFADSGYLVTQAGVEHKNLFLTIETVLKEYAKIRENLVSEKELKDAKEYLKGKMVMNFETSDEVNSFFINQEVKKRKIMSIDEMSKRIESVSREDVLRVAGEIFKSEKLNLAIIGPHKKSVQLEKSLKI